MLQPIPSPRSPASWNKDMTKKFIDVLLEEIAASKINTETLDSTGHAPTVDAKQAKNKTSTSKKDRDTFLKVKGCSGFEWDPETCTITAPADVKERIIKIVEFSLANLQVDQLTNSFL
ncbi:hypothetical protein FPQ18DRAFT_387871 [Pyronema domesticum]|uniref:Myb/SANT-like domain-containing protein n=1 Tax=Pyronema omphalodes (strain CBS 100304) TaxID=1076935 RepID=U4L798_PYROM|nr:hypothetical protein FPQ18DRAFT_387871 [Pyronema domesticum]CCX12355.1 Protein of unknown function [Pyronema omphalodes CBS 100304]